MRQNITSKLSQARATSTAQFKISLMGHAGTSLGNTIFTTALGIALLPQMVFAQADPGPSESQTALIRQRIETVHARQAEYLGKVASGDAVSDTALQQQWPKIQEDVHSIRTQISALNDLDGDDPQRPAIESTLLSSLQALGPFLTPAEHPPFTPRTLDDGQVAEMKRIEDAIANIEYVDRDEAQPVGIMGFFPVYTLVNLPVPIMLKTQPGEMVYLYAETGGMFSNGLSAIELEADDQGVAQTTWMTIGESVGTSHLSLLSRIGIERRDLVIEVVSPSLAAIEGVAVPEDAKLPAPPVIHSRSLLRSK